MTEKTAQSEILWCYLNAENLIAKPLSDAIDRFTYYVLFPASRYPTTCHLDVNSRAEAIAQSILLSEPLQNTEHYNALEYVFNKNVHDYCYFDSAAGTRAHLAFKAMLPVAKEGQKKIKTLERACSNYIDYLQEKKRNPLTIPFEELEKIEKKIQICQNLITSLDSGLTVVDKLSSFKRSYNINKSDLEQHRDSGFIRFLKILAAVFSLGLAAQSLFKVKGEETTAKIDAVFATQPTM